MKNECLETDLDQAACYATLNLWNSLKGEKTKEEGKG